MMTKPDFRMMLRDALALRSSDAFIAPLPKGADEFKVVVGGFTFSLVRDWDSFPRMNRRWEIEVTGARLTVLTDVDGKLFYGTHNHYGSQGEWVSGEMFGYFPN